MPYCLIFSVAAKGLGTVDGGSYAGIKVIGAIGIEATYGVNYFNPGILATYGIGRKEAEDLILGARVVAGWISPEDLIREEAPAEEAADTAPGEAEPTEGEAAAAASAATGDAAPAEAASDEDSAPAPPAAEPSPEPARAE